MDFYVALEQIKMIQTIIQFCLPFGLFLTWLGAGCLFIAVARPNFSFRRMRENFSLSYADRMKRMNDDLVQSLKSRLAHFGQLLVAIGLSLLIFVGFLWLGLQISGG